MWHPRKGIYSIRVLFQNAVSPKAGILCEPTLRHSPPGPLWINDCNTPCHEWNVCVSPRRICGSPNPQFDGFRRYLGLANVMGVEPPRWDWCPNKGMKGLESCLFPSWGCSREAALSTRKVPPWGTRHAGTLTSDSRPPEWWEIKCCSSHPVCGLCYSSPNGQRHTVNVTIWETDDILWVSRKDSARSRRT